MSTDTATAQVSARRGGLIGAVAAVPFAGLVLLVFIASMPGFALSVAGASVASGILCGATFGRRVAMKPRLATVIGGAGLAVIVGSPIGGVLATLLVDGVTNPFTATLAGFFLYGLPAFLVLALPAFALGVWIVGRFDPGPALA